VRRRFHARVIALAVAAAAAVALGAGFAFAKTPPIGSGVVVIDTNLAYQGGQAAGTGMVLTSSGLVLTNNHVIRGATTIKIVLPGTGHSYTAGVVGYSVSGDVAVLRARGASNLKTVSIGNSSTLKLGQHVTAIGNAGGTGALTSVSGAVTALHRSITVNDEQGGTASLANLVETNAGLRAGDSGGPLLNAARKVIGMDTAASVSYAFRQISAGDGYAIPINKVMTLAKQIEARKASASVHVGKTAFLGVEVVDPSTADGYFGTTSGALITGVASGGPASASGLGVGDTITALGGHTIASPIALTSAVLAQKAGTKVSVTYVDTTGTNHSASVTLGSGPPQ
jgi:S1-C subfamily serine protease